MRSWGLALLLVGCARETSTPGHAPPPPVPSVAAASSALAIGSAKARGEALRPFRASLCTKSLPHQNGEAGRAVAEEWLGRVLSHCADFPRPYENCDFPPVILCPDDAGVLEEVAARCHNMCSVWAAQIDACARRVANGETARCGAANAEEERGCAFACAVRADAVLRAELNPVPSGGRISR